MSFLNNVIGSLGNAITGGIVGKMFGGGQSFNKTRWQQYQMSQDAAQINFRYGEKAAQEAFNRQMIMYEKTRQDNSFEARRKQLEDAGLSVGLMYGQAGQGGGGAGSLGGGTQGQTGGAKAADATAAYGMALQAKQLRLQEIATMADANLKNAQAKEAEESAEKIGEDTETVKVMRDLLAENARQEAWGKWLENIPREWALDAENISENGKDSVEVVKYRNSILNREVVVDGRSVTINRMLSEMLAAAEDAAVKTSDAAMKNAIANLETKKEKYYLLELLVEIQKANNDSIKAAAQKLDAETRRHAMQYNTGEEYNWKTFVDLGLSLVGAAAKFRTKKTAESITNVWTQK